MCCARCSTRHSTLVENANYNSGWRVLYVGGNWNNGSNAGLFYFNANNDSSNSNSNIGARLLVYSPFIIAQTLPHHLVKILPIRKRTSRFILENLRGKQGDVFIPKRKGYLYEKMLDKEQIRFIIQEAARGKTNRREVRRVLKNLDLYVDKTYEMLATESFKPSVPHEKEIYDVSSQKVRIIKTVPFWPDGIMHWLIVDALKPVFMKGMYDWSCASIPGRGGVKVQKKIQKFIRTSKKAKYAAELDVSKYYPSISTDTLIELLRRKVKDKKMIKIVQDIAESCGGGLAIGYYICQWLANFYLESLDHYIVSLPGVDCYTRYMDNITLIGANKKLLHEARRKIEMFLKDKLSLRLKENWQVYRLSFTRKVAQKHLLLDEKQQRLRKPRLVSAVGCRFAKTYTIVRKRNFLRLARQSRKIQKKQNKHLKISFNMATGFINRIAQLTRCDSQYAKEKYVYSINMKQLKEVIRNESKRKLCSKQKLSCRGNPG